MDGIDWDHLDLNHIPWNKIIHTGEMMGVGYVGLTTGQWLVTNLIVPGMEMLTIFTGMLIVWRVASKYIAMKRKQAEAVLRQAPQLQMKLEKQIIEIEGYVSPLHDRVRRRKG